MFLLQADRFRFGPEILVRSIAIWFGLEIVLGKMEHFYIIQKLIDRNKTFWFGPLIIRTKAKRFDLVRLLSERQHVSFIYSPPLSLNASSHCKHKIIIQTGPGPTMQVPVLKHSNGSATPGNLSSSAFSIYTKATMSLSSAVVLNSFSMTYDQYTDFYVQWWWIFMTKLRVFEYSFRKEFPAN